jgi:CHAT domain-containing protein
MTPGAHLMTEFYQHMLHDSMAPQAALGTAMRSMVLQDQWADPALWAAFQVSVAALRCSPRCEPRRSDP